MDINIHDSIALLIAVKKGCYDSVEFLLKAGANIYARNDKVFKYGIKDEDPIMIKILLQYYHGSDKKKKKYYNIAYSLKNRKYKYRHILFHGYYHRVHPNNDTYELCNLCQPHLIGHMSEYFNMEY